MQQFFERRQEIEQELAEFRDAAARDTLKALGPMSDEEHDYYNNPKNFKKYDPESGSVV